MEPTSSQVLVPSSIASITLETFPVDTIDRATSCALHIPYNRKGKTIKVARGNAYPGCTMHSNALLDDYAGLKCSQFLRIILIIKLGSLLLMVRWSWETL